MFSTLKPSTTLMAFVLLYTSSLQVVKAVPAPGGAPWVPILETIDCANEPPNSILQYNALEAQDLNSMFEVMDEADPCQDGETACIDSQFAQCTSSKWTLTPCTSGRSCFALPLFDEPGTDIVCEFPSNAVAIFEAACMQSELDGSLFSRHEDCGDEGDDGDDDDDDDGDGDDGGDDDCDETKPGSNNDIPVITVTTTVTITPTPTGTNMNGGPPSFVPRQIKTLPVLPGGIGAPDSAIPATTPTN